MRSRSIVILLAVAAVGSRLGGLGTQVRGQDRGPGIAGFMFDNGGSIGQDKENFDGLQGGIRGMLISELAANPAVRLVEREQVQHLLDEQNLGAAGRVDAQTAAKIGKIVGARYAITGMFMDFSGDFRLDIRLVNVETTEIVRVEADKMSRDHLFDLIRTLAQRLTLNQIRFTATDAIGLVVLLSGILSFLVISQAVRELGQLGATDFIGTLIVVAIVRELGPLITALTVAGRSGTAIAAELATNRVLGEVRALEAMGIDPRQYLVLPRFFGSLVSVFVLLVVFDIVAVSAGFAAARFNGMVAGRYVEIVLQALAPKDVWLTGAKAVTFGVIVGIVPAYYGLAVRGAPTEIPIATSRATVTSIVGIFLCSALFVVIG